MSNNHHSGNIGEQMKDALTEALRSGDFKNLNEIVSQTVINTVNDVKRQITPDSGKNNGNGQNVAPGAGKSSGAGPSAASAPGPSGTSPDTRHPAEGGAAVPSAASALQQRIQERMLQKQHQLELQKQERKKKSLLARTRFNKIGSVSGILYQVFGGIGLGITGLFTFFRLLALLYSSTTAGGWIINIFFLAFFFGMIRLGIFQHRRLKRAERYIQLCGENRFGQTANLARATGKEKSFVVKDLQKMLKLGMFPEGHLDETKNCFMLNDEIYRQYLDAESSRQVREQERRQALEQQEQPQLPPLHPEEDKELNAMMSEGMEFIRKLRDLNDKIPGEGISAKLFCLENLLKDIFDGVRTHPEQMHQMHKLMHYYLPTTLKLVEAYEEFDSISSPGEDIIKAKAEIENTLDTINEAFRELLNKLFQHAVFDATTDAQVLKSMLAREGLMRELDFVPAGRQ